MNLPLPTNRGSSPSRTEPSQDPSRVDHLLLAAARRSSPDNSETNPANRCDGGLRCPRRQPSGSGNSLKAEADEDDIDATSVSINDIDGESPSQSTPVTSSNSSIPRAAGEEKEERAGEEKEEQITVSTCHDMTDHGSSSSHANNNDVNVNQRNTRQDKDAKNEGHLINQFGEIDISEEREARENCGSSSTSTPNTSGTVTVPVLTEERVRSFLTDYYEDFDSIFQKNSSNKQMQRSCFESFFDQYYTKDVLWIRSSGNPIGRQDLAGLLTDNIDVEHAILVSIDHISLLAGGTVATVTYTADLIFSFQGNAQSDRTVLSSVLHLEGTGQPKIAHVHWSVGQPIPRASRWN